MGDITHFKGISAVNGFYIGAKGAERLVVGLGLSEPGNQFFVDSGIGADSNNGKGWATALATLDAAFAKCTANNGDIVWVAPGHSETYTTTGNKITADVAGVRVIGVGYGADRPTFTFSHTGATMAITAASVVFDNLLFVTGVDSVTTIATISGNDCIMGHPDGYGVEVRDTIDVEVIDAFKVTGDRFKANVFHYGYTSGNANLTTFSMNGVADAEIYVTALGKAGTAIVNFVTAASTNVLIKGNFLVTGTTNLSKNVVATIGSNTWQVEGFDLGAGYEFSGGSGAAVTGSDVSALGTKVDSVGTLAGSTATSTQATSVGTLVTSVGTLAGSGATATNVTSVGTQVSSVGTQSTSVGTLTTSIGTLVTSVSTQAASVGTLTASVGTQTASVGTLVTSVGTLAGSAATATGVTSVGTLTTSVGTVVASAASTTNATSVGTLVTSVGTLAGSAATTTNATSVGTLVTSVGTLAGSAATTTSATSVGTLVTSVGTLTSSVGTVVASAATTTNATSVGTLVTSVGTLTSSVGTVVASAASTTSATSVGTLVTSVGTLTSSVGTVVASAATTTNVTSVGTLVTSVGTQTGSVGTLTTSVGTQLTTGLLNLGGSLVRKTITHSGAASYTAFTVTGCVAVKVIGYITTALTNHADTTSVGTSTSVAGLIAATAGTAMQTVNQVWVDNAPSKFETFPSGYSVLGDGEDIAVDGSVNLVGGVVELYCLYIPLSADGAVAAA
ncbi:MAG: hypothetical protein WC616_02440 [Candidatus Omnitrophota bacterium]